MNFDKAHEQLLKGKKIRRKEWETYTHLQFIDGKVKTYAGEVTIFYQDADIINSDGWLILHDEDKKEYKFIEAIELLKAKKFITNKSWIDKGIDQFLFIDDMQFVLCKKVEYQFMPTFKCLCSNDWEIIK